MWHPRKGHLKLKKASRIPTHVQKVIRKYVDTESRLLIVKKTPYEEALQSKGRAAAVAQDFRVVRVSFGGAP